MLNYHEAARIHGFKPIRFNFSEDSDSDDCRYEELERLRPPPIPLQQILHRIVIIDKSESDEDSIKEFDTEPENGNADRKIVRNRRKKVEKHKKFLEDFSDMFAEFKSDMSEDDDELEQTNSIINKNDQVNSEYGNFEKIENLNEPEPLISECSNKLSEITLAAEFKVTNEIYQQTNKKTAKTKKSKCNKHKELHEQSKKQSNNRKHSTASTVSKPILNKQLNILEINKQIFNLDQKNNKHDNNKINELNLPFTKKNKKKRNRKNMVNSNLTECDDKNIQENKINKNAFQTNSTKSVSNEISEVKRIPVHEIPSNSRASFVDEPKTGNVGWTIVSYRRKKKIEEHKKLSQQRKHLERPY